MLYEVITRQAADFRRDRTGLRGPVNAAGRAGEAGLRDVPGAPPRAEALKMLKEACGGGDDYSCQVMRKLAP